MMNLEQEWNRLASRVIPNHPPNSTQHVEMRKAFVAGCWITLHKFESAAATASDADEIEAVRQLELFKAEVRLALSGYRQAGS